MTGDILPFIPKHELTQEQRDYWYQVLEDSERQVEYARRVLGLLAVEHGIGND